MINPSDTRVLGNKLRMYLVQDSNFESRDDSKGARQKSGSFIDTFGLFFQLAGSLTMYFLN